MDAATTARNSIAFSLSTLSPTPSPDFNTFFNHLNTLLLSDPAPLSHHKPRNPSATLSSSTNSRHLPVHGQPLASLSTSLFHHFSSLLSPITGTRNSNPTPPIKKNRRGNGKVGILFSSTTLSTESGATLTSPQVGKPNFDFSLKWLKPSTRAVNSEAKSLAKALSVFERSLIGAMAGGIAGAFTYVFLLPIDTIKTKLQTKGAAQIYTGALDVAVQTFRSSGILGFYRGVSAVIVGSAFSSAVYFGTCELGKSVLAKIPSYPPILIPPTAGAMGNIVSSAIMVPKELITQKMQAGAAGRSWEVVLRIVKNEGFLGLYSGYSATLLRNLPTGILSYSSFEYSKGFVLRVTGQNNLEPVQSICCGALAGAISASLTTPLDVVKTRLMTRAHGEAASKISDTVRQILMEEGWVGLTRGIGPRILHSACFAALGYCAFETARLTLFHQYVQRKEKEVADTNG